jgi:CRP-like cAMP-binding protein
MTTLCAEAQSNEAASTEAALQEAWLFSDCSAGELDQLAARALPMEIPAGRTLLHEDDAHDACYVVVDGEAALTRRGRVLGRATRGKMIGITSLVGDGTSNVTAVAATPLSVLRVERATLEAYVAREGWSVRHRLEVIAAERGR